MSYSLEHQPETRHKGVMALITRDCHQTTEVLTVMDHSKEEVSAGLPPYFSPADQPRLNVFAGGSQLKPNGQEESVLETVRREWIEEMTELQEVMPLVADVLREELARVGIEHQQVAPFIVAQLQRHESGNLAVINESAVTSIEFPFDALAKEIRLQLRLIEAKKKAHWIPLQELEHAFQLSQTRQPVRLRGELLRPQLLTAAMLHGLEMDKAMEKDAIRQVVTQWNRRLYQFLTRYSRQHQTPINNGVFTSRGTPRKNLSMADQVFLNV